MAIEYGMTPHQYWDEEVELFYVYQKAYINRIHNTAHINGLYINLALETCFYNLFRDTKKNNKAKEYPINAVFNPFINVKNNGNNNGKNFIDSFDTSKNNNQIYKIKSILKERREKNGRL